jgi:hypothetical protein
MKATQGVTQALPSYHLELGCVAAGLDHVQANHHPVLEGADPSELIVCRDACLALELHLMVDRRKCVMNRFEDQSGGHARRALE